MKTLTRYESEPSTDRNPTWLGKAFDHWQFNRSIDLSGHFDFLYSLPGWEKSLYGFPALSGSGGFLLKGVLLLLGAAFWTLGDSLSDQRL